MTAGARLPGPNTLPVNRLVAGADGEVVISRSGVTESDLLAINDILGLSAALAAKPDNLVDLGDVDTVPPALGYVPIWNGSNKFVFGPMTGGVGSSALSELTDVQLTALAAGDHLEVDLDGVTWVNVPGSNAQIPVHVPENYGAVGDMKSFVKGLNTDPAGTKGLSITSGTNTLTLVGAGFVPGDVGKLIIGNFGVGGATKVAQIKTRTGNTTVTLCIPGTNTNYNAQSTVVNGYGAFYSQDSTTAGRSKDGVAWQACITAAVASGLPIYGTPSKRYAMDVNMTQLNNTKAVRIESPGGRAYINSDGTVNAGGCVVGAVSETPIIIFESGNTAISHSGLHVENFGGYDPLMGFVHGFIRCKYQTRWRLIENMGVGFAICFELDSGAKDISWGYAIGNTWTNNTINWKLFNQLDGDGGAMAIRIIGGDGHVNANQTGFDWAGGQYGYVGDMKWDMDGFNCKGAILRGQAPGAVGVDGKPIPSSGLLLFNNIQVEAGTTNNFNAESVVIDILGGVANIGIRDLQVGGAGAANAGTTLRMTGVSSGQRVENVRVYGGNSRGRETFFIFGPWTRNCWVQDHVLNGAGKYARVDANSQNCGMKGCTYAGINSNPLDDPTRIDINPLSLRFYLYDYQWDTDRSFWPRFNGVPPAHFGSIGDDALNTATGKKYTKAGAGSGVWAVSGL